MTCLRTYIPAILIFFLLINYSCNKDNGIKQYNPLINSAKPDLVKDWTKLSLELIPKCNGYNDLIASRTMYYISVTMYESLLPGFEGYQTLQAKISGLNTTLPQPDESKKYDWLIVANQSLHLVCNELFKSAGSENLVKITTLRDNNIAALANGISDETISNSKDLGNIIGWRMIDYLRADGRADYYLKVDNNINIPAKYGGWIPTPPDYTSQIVLPSWGESVPALVENINKIQPYKFLEYSTSDQSIIYAEALEVYNLTTNLTVAQQDLIRYWNDRADPRATPLCHNVLLLNQMLDDRDFDLDQAVELFLRMSIAHYDGYILSWKIKIASNLMRPFTYIKQNFNPYFIPEFICTPVPEFASEKALIYNASAEIFSHYFGHRSSFIDFTQNGRKDLQNSKKYFASFSDMAKEAAYSDLYSATHFRTSIDAGLQMGYDIAQRTLDLKLK